MDHDNPRTTRRTPSEMAHFMRAEEFAFTHAAIPRPVSLSQNLADTIAAHHEADGTFARLWPTAIELSTFLCEHPEMVAGKRIVELGAGSGAVGLVCAALGAASVTLTDVPEALPLLEANLKRNTHLASTVQISPCTWNDAEHIDALLRGSGGGFDIVLCCEVIYQQGADVLVALAQTQRALSRPDGGTKVLLAYEFRNAISEDIAYFDQATDLFGDSESHTLDGNAAEAYMGGHKDDGGEDRFLYVYDVPPRPR